MPSKKNAPFNSKRAMLAAIHEHPLAGNSLLAWDDSRRETAQLGAVGVALQVAL